VLVKIAGSDATWYASRVTQDGKLRVERWEPRDEVIPSEVLVVPESRVVATKKRWRWERRR
jgi:hypothetical protein